MLSGVPNYVSITFLLICGVTLVVFLRLLLAPLVAAGQIRTAWIVGISIFAWLGSHSFLAYEEFYSSSYALPPRGFLMLIPPMVAISVSHRFKLHLHPHKHVFYKRFQQNTIGFRRRNRPPPAPTRRCGSAA